MNALLTLINAAVEHGTVEIKNEMSNGCLCGSCHETVITLKAGGHISKNGKYTQVDVELCSGERFEEIVKQLEELTEEKINEKVELAFKVVDDE